MHTHLKTTRSPKLQDTFSLHSRGGYGCHRGNACRTNRAIGQEYIILGEHWRRGNGAGNSPRSPPATEATKLQAGQAPAAHVEQVGFKGHGLNGVRIIPRAKRVRCAKAMRGSADPKIDLFPNHGRHALRAAATGVPGTKRQRNVGIAA